MDVSFALAVIFTGIVIVFLVLVLLIAIMMIMGKLLYKPQQPAAPQKPDTPASPHRAAAGMKAAPMPIVESGIEEETIAVISAAIAALTGGAGRIASIRKAAGRSHGKRRAWASAGLRENTQPF